MRRSAVVRSLVLAVLLGACSAADNASLQTQAPADSDATNVSTEATDGEPVAMTAATPVTTAATPVTTTEPLDIDAMLLDILNVGSGWIPSEKLSQLPEQRTLTPVACDEIYGSAPKPDEIAVVGFENPEELSQLRQEVRLFPDEATAAAKIENEMAFFNACKAVVVDDIKLDIKGYGNALPNEVSYISYLGTYTGLANGITADFAYTVVRRGRVVASLEVVERPPSFSIVTAYPSLVTQMLALLPPGPPPEVVSISIDDTAPDAQAAPDTTSLAGAIGDNLVFWSYFEVPQLGDEPVRGSGCGANGSLPPQLPDGLWLAEIASWGASTMDVDIVCVYFGDAGREMLAQACAADPESDECIQADPEWFWVNTSTKLRTMPVASNVTYVAGSLGEPITRDPSSPDATWSGYSTWLLIENGEVRIVYSPPPYS